MVAGYDRPRPVVLNEWERRETMVGMEPTRPFAGLGLYFPTMVIRDDTWLRSAFLSWHKMTRIAPAPHVYGDSPIVGRLVDEVGFLTSSPPSRAEVESAGTELVEIITEYDRNPVLDQFRICDSNGRLRPEAMGDHPPWSNAATAPGGNLTYILAETPEGRDVKVSETLRSMLRSRGLATNWSDGRAGYLGVHPKLGWTYMSRLTQIMAENRRYSPITDIPAAYATGRFEDMAGIAGYLFDDERAPAPPDGDHDRRQLYLQVALEDVIPSNLGAISWDRLIAFRKHHEDELSAFHKHITDFAPKLTAIGDVSDPEALTAHIAALYRQETRPMLDDLRRALDSAGIDALGGALVLKVDATSIAGTALGAGALAAGGSPVLTAAGVAAAIVPSVAATWRRRHQQVRESPVSYLLAAGRLGSPTSILRRILPASRRL